MSPDTISCVGRGDMHADAKRILGIDIRDVAMTEKDRRISVLSTTDIVNEAIAVELSRASACRCSPAEPD